MATTKTAFRPGEGPIEKILQAWMDGQIGRDVAISKARQQQVFDAYPPEALAAMSDAAVRLGYNGKADLGYDIHELVWACCDAGGAKFAGIRARTAVEHLRCATTALWERPDPDLYKEAFALGVAEYDRAKGHDRQVLAREIGILHLDPFAAERADRQKLRLWLDKQVPSATGGQMPDVLDALNISEQWLRKGLATAASMERVELLKAVLQCMFAKEAFGSKLDETSARSLIHEAAGLASLASQRADLMGYLQQVALRFKVPFASDPLTELLKIDWQAKGKYSGITQIESEVSQVLGGAIGVRDADGLRLAESVLPVIEERSPEAYRRRFYDIIYSLLAGGKSSLPASPGVVDAALASLTKHLDRSPAAEQASRQVMSWVRGLMKQEHEDEAFQLLGRLQQAAPQFWDRWARPLLYIAALLRVNQAKNALEARNFREAVQRDYESWDLCQKIGCYELGFEGLTRLVDLLSRTDAAAVQVICELVRSHPAPDAEDMEDLWHEACANLANSGMRAMKTDGSVDGWFALLRLAKGPAYADLVMQTERFDWRSDEFVVDQLRRISQVERSDPNIAALKERTSIPEVVLVSHRSVPLASAGQTAAEQRDGLARALDLRVQRRLALLGSPSGERFRTKEVMGALPEDAVLLDFYLPRLGSEISCVCLLLTREHQRLFASESRDAIKGIGVKGSLADHEMTPLAFGVSAWREALKEAPPPGRRQSEHADALGEELTRGFFGYGAEHLEELYQKGKRHLIVVPSGAMHFCPVHLLGLNGHDLAEKWTVTYLPTMELLVRPRDEGRRGASVLGLDYSGAPWTEAGVDPLPAVRDEVEAVAKALGVAPILNGKATRSAAISGLSGSGHVHIACHGLSDAIAPSLQAMLLTPEGDDDGRLRTLDILGLDLRGLSVLSLSACETALGRFDYGDNVRGLSAAAIAAGASCVVGTLWPALDSAAAVFFIEFSGAIKAGEARRSAFRRAQQRTREKFPDLRDWGPFYLSGAW